MTESREHFALDWIKRELDETLNTARQALEAYAASDRDETKMRACLTYLHQVHGTLLMLELTGVTVLSDEMEQLAQAMLTRSVAKVDAAQQLLMQSILQLPAYLEEIQKGVPDSRRAVLPLANELRGARGVSPIADAGSRAGAELREAATDETLRRFNQIDGTEKVRKIRAVYQQVLLSVLKREDPRAALATLSKIATGLERICEQTPYTSLWRAFSAFVAALSQSQAELNGDIVRLLRRVDAEIKTLAQHGAAALSRPLSLDLVKQLVDAARTHGNSSAEIKKLGEAIEEEPADERVTISKREAIHTAAAALREELATVKDKLDLFVRGEDRSTEPLRELAAPLKQIGSTLSILGFESSRAVIADQVEAINAALKDKGVCDDVLLLGVASALLQVDENLAAIAQQRSGVSSSQESVGVINDAQAAVLGEARAGLEQVKQAVVDYVSAQWDANCLADVPALLAAIKGALAMVPLTRPAEQLGRCARYVSDELIEGHAPDWATLDAFADAISGIDYYLERLCDDTSPPGDEVLNLVERGLTQLGFGKGSEKLLREAKPITVRVERDDVHVNDDARVVRPERGAAAASAVEEVELVDVETEELEDEFAAETEERFDDAVEPELDEEVEDEVEQELAEEVVEIVAVEDDASAKAPVVSAASAPPAVEPARPEVKPRAPSVAPPSTDFDLVIEDPDEVSSGAVSVDELEDDAFDLGALFDEEDKAAKADAPPPRVDRETVEPEAAKAEPPPAAAEPSVIKPMRITAVPSDVDAEILQIFVEEVAEVMDSVDQWLPQWAAELNSAEALAEIRRAFHTLKGSGRIVGADVIGELAWSIENMLNRVIDGTVEPNLAMTVLTRGARVAVPELYKAFESGQAVFDNVVSSIIEKADLLASGALPDDLAGNRVESEVAPVVAAKPADVAVVDALSRPDDEMFALFEREAATHLDVLVERFSNADKIGAGALNDDAVRALHTLLGSASMAGVDSISRVAGPLYRVVREARDRGARLGPDIVDFIQHGVFALQRSLRTLAEGGQPLEDYESFENESGRIVAALGEARVTASSLLSLDGAPVLLSAREFLSGWRSGAMDLGALSDTVEALHELRNAAESQGQRPITSLCDALIAAYERLEDHQLDKAGHATLSQGHERLLEMFDAIAAEQRLPDPAKETAALAALQIPQRADADVDLSEPVERPAPASPNVVEFPTFVRPPAPPKAENVAPPPQTAQPSAPPPAPAVEARAEPREAPAPAPKPASAPRPPVTLPPDADNEILEIFFEEAEELLETIDQSVHEWRTAPENVVHREVLLRCLHTLKGGARLAGLTGLGDDAHAFESTLVGVQDDALTPTFFDAMQTRHDEMLVSVLAFRAAASGTAPAATVAPAPVIAESAPATPVVSAPAPVTAVTPPPVVPRTGVPLKPVVSAPAADDYDDEAEEPAKPARGRAAPEPREQVRVSAGLLEQLVNLAGESSIIRSRVEQGMNDFSTSLEEMETTIERVREQLRRLEIETETQVLFREEVNQGTDYQEFDPLEMDRYSQLQQLSRALSESASDMLELKDSLTFKARESETLLLQQARVNTELQEGLMRTRMVPFSRLLPRLRRTVRQVSAELGKEVDFNVHNAEGELDRNMLDRMVPPLEHMLRNAVDHGIEPASVRRGYNKPETGRIDLRVSREAGDVVIEIADDGAGIDVESVRAKAIENGLMTADARLRDDEILQFVLAAGFSTAKSITQISGRGVGMDVVQSAVKQLGGSITIMSVPGKGTRFVVRLPFTVSVNRALMVSVGEDQYAIPLNTIEGIVRVSGGELEKLYKPDGGGFEYAGMQYRVRYLGSFIGRDHVALADRTSVPVVLVRAGDRAVAVHVDGVQGSREIVVKGLGPQFAGVGGISGATILGDGSVVVILDLIALIRAQTTPSVANGKPAGVIDRPICVMVVDDSVTVRKVTSRLLERQGMDVILAKDGVEAVAMLQERRPDIMLLDIEMPRMDGFEVARQIRHDDRLANLPIVIISSRTGNKHQERATELGVNRFLGKPFQENELLATIAELVH
jgi:chemosensory pili system protein ChpA (sensor histidine kinase/response regulator)